MIALGVLDPFDYLDPHRHSSRSEKRTKRGNGKGRYEPNHITRSHPQLDTYLQVKEALFGLEETDD